MDNPVVQVAIGLVFLFATVAGLVSAVTEMISRYIGLRAEYLLRGIRTMLDGGGHFELPLFEALTGRLRRDRKPAAAHRTAETALVTKVLAHPLVAGTSDKGEVPDQAGNRALTNKQRRALPSYVSGRNFARALIDLLVPDSRGHTTVDAVRAKLADKDTPCPAALREALLTLTNEAGNDIERFRTAVAQWYDDQMARVSGWYKRHARWISLGIGVVLVAAFNLNVLSIARNLYTDQALQGSVVSQATQASKCEELDPAQCLRKLRTELVSVRGAGLPIGWSTVPECSGKHCNWAERRGLWGAGRTVPLQIADALLLLLGWALMIFALLPGSRFWFDILGRLGTLRSSGPKPAAT